MKKTKDENTETTENVKKKKKTPIIAVVILIVIIGSCNANRNKDDSVSDSSTSSSESSLAETTDKATEESSATEKITEESTTEKNTEEETMIADKDISPESFVNDVEEAIQGAVGSDEYITDVVLTDDTLTISVDLSKADVTIVPLEDLAVSRASSITDSFLELEQYDDLWNKIVIDFGNVGLVSRTSNDIVENEYGMRYFEIYELDSDFSNDKTATEEITTEFSTDIVIATINLALGQQDFGYEVNYNEEIDTYIANMWYDGLAAAMVTNPSQCTEVQEAAVNLCKSLYDSIQEVDPGTHFSIFILNDINKENVLITLLDGVVVNSILSE